MSFALTGALSHADQSQAVHAMVNDRIEAHAIVNDAEQKLARIHFQPHRCAARRPAVLDHIMERFLRDPVDAQCDVSGDYRRDVADFDTDGNATSCAKQTAAPPSHASNTTASRCLSTRCMGLLYARGF